MSESNDWKMLFGIENEYNTNRLYYAERGELFSYAIPHAMVIAAEEFGGFAEGICRFVDEDLRREKLSESIKAYERDSDRLRIRGLTGLRMQNRMRIYVDMGHPEISTAECTNPRDLLLQQKASERMIEAMRKKATYTLGLTDDPI